MENFDQTGRVVQEPHTLEASYALGLGGGCLVLFH